MAAIFAESCRVVSLLGYELCVACVLQETIVDCIRD